MSEKLMKMLEPHPKEGDVWGRVTEIETKYFESKPYYEIIIDIVNEKMLKSDSIFAQIVNKNKDDLHDHVDYINDLHYTNELYFYYLNIKTYDPFIMKFFLEKRSDKYYKYKITELIDEELYSTKGNGIFRTYLESMFNRGPFYYDDTIIGEVFFSASPTVSKPYTIKLTSEEKSAFEVENKIPDECKYNDQAVLNNKISDIINTFGSYVKTIDIFHVGSGYYSCLKSETGNSFLHDIGLTRYSDRHSVLCPVHDYSKLKFVILSHWDADHFMGITLHDTTQKDAILSIPWICPSIMNGVNASRLAFQVAYRSKSNLIIVEENVYGTLFKNKNLSIIKGFCSYGNIGEKKNRNGITVFAKKRKNYAALGDVYYEFLEDTHFPFKKADYLVVPHHGAYCSSSVKILPRKKGSIAIIPVGINPEDYGHPDDRTVGTIRNLGYEVHNTNIDGPRTLEI